MSTPPICPKCGSTNFVGARFCQNCGNPLPTVQQGPTIPPAPPTTPTGVPTPLPGLRAPSPVPFSYGPPGFPSYEEGRRRERIDRTETGLFLLLIGTILGVGTVLGSLSGAGILGLAFGGLRFVLSLAGVIMILIGREAFAKVHSTYVILSIVLYIAGAIVGFIAGLFFAFALIQAAATNQGAAALQNALASNINMLFVGVFIGQVVTGVAYVLLTYALQKPFGRLLLWTAYAASLALGVATLYILGSQVTDAVRTAFSGGNFNRAAIDNLQSQASTLGLLGAIPTVIYAVSYYLAWSRVKNREIPEPLAAVIPSTSTIP